MFSNEKSERTQNIDKQLQDYNDDLKATLEFISNDIENLMGSMKEGNPLIFHLIGHEISIADSKHEIQKITMNSVNEFANESHSFLNKLSQVYEQKYDELKSSSTLSGITDGTIESKEEKSLKRKSYSKFSSITI